MRTSVFLVALTAIAVPIYAIAGTDGRNITPGTTPLTALQSQSANTIVGNCTGSGAVPTACSASAAKSSLAITAADVLFNTQLLLTGIVATPQIDDSKGTDYTTFSLTPYTTHAILLTEGTNGSPVTSAGAVIKIAKTQNEDNAVVCTNGLGNPNDSECSAPLQVLVKGKTTNTVALNAIYGSVASYGTTTSPDGSSDGFALIGEGLAAGSSVGLVGGGYLVGHRYDTSPRIIGVEISAFNHTTTDCDNGYSSSSTERICDGIISAARGTPSLVVNTSTAFRAVRGNVYGKWIAGLTLDDSAISLYGVQDRSQATTSYFMAGTHDYGIDGRSGTFNTAFIEGNGVIKLNNNSNHDISLGTGSSTGSVNIGGGSNTSIAIAGPVFLNHGVNKTTNIGTSTTTSPVNIGGGANTVNIGSGAGGGNTIQGTTSINASTNAVTNIGTGTTSSTVSIGGGSNTVAIGSGTGGTNTIQGTTSINSNVNADVNLATGTSTGTVNIGGGSGTVAVGGTVFINTSQNHATNIGTGTTTSNISIGGGANTVFIGVGTGGTNTIKGATTINGSNNAASNIGTGTTTSNVTIGGTSNLVVLPGISTDATHTDATVCEDTTTHALYFGSGTLGACLGTSSARYKEAIKPLPVGMAAILALKPSSFFYKKGRGDNGAKENYGFIAEDVVKVLPKLVGLDADKKPNSVDLLGMVPVLVKAVQELQAEVNALKAKNAELEGRVPVWSVAPGSGPVVFDFTATNTNH